MKNILFKSLAAVVLLGGLSSCSDFLGWQEHFQ